MADHDVELGPEFVALLATMQPESLAYQLQHLSDDKSLSLRVICIVGVVSATLAVGLRLYARRLVEARFSADDWTILASMLVFYPLWGWYIIGIWYDGLGRHEAIVSPSRVIGTLQLFYAAQILVCIIIPLTKVFILFFYDRIFAVASFRPLCRFWIGFSICQMLGGTMAAILECVPVAGVWNLTIPSRCIIYVAWYVGQAAFNILTDLVILIMPLPAVWSLRIARRQKVAVCSIFVLGSLVCLAPMMRIVAVYQIDYSDRTWTYTSTTNWSMVESFLSIVCACLPTMRPLFRGFFQGFSTGGYVAQVSPLGDSKSTSRRRFANVRDPWGTILLQETPHVPETGMETGIEVGMGTETGPQTGPSRLSWMRWAENMDKEKEKKKDAIALCSVREMHPRQDSGTGDVEPLVMVMTADEVLTSPRLSN
ncbi:MAG: hypothetical protein M1838_003736 [Thelocarpon superellum]|nr:MAG: hypothetical protein M1838_003736 [Thelocarpon superellum]